MGEWGRSAGPRADGRPDFKSRVSRFVATRLEPFALTAADGVTAVSRATYEQALERTPGAQAAPLRRAAHRLGPPRPRVPRRPRPTRSFQTTGWFICRYVGTLLPTGFETLRAVLAAVARVARAPTRRGPAAAAFFRHEQPADRRRAAACLPVAAEYGLIDVVTEHAPRLDYFDALGVLRDSTAVLLMGSSERHYTPSKVFPALIARRPVLAVLHAESNASELLRPVGRPRCGWSPTTSRRRRPASRPSPASCRRSSRIPRRAGRRERERPRAFLGVCAGRPACEDPRRVPRMSAPPVRLTVVQTHPVQYNAPWFRHIAANCPELDLTVVYAARPRPEQQGAGFDLPFEWDTPLLDGYAWQLVREGLAADEFSTGRFRGLDVPDIGDAVAATRRTSCSCRAGTRSRSCARCCRPAGGACRCCTAATRTTGRGPADGAAPRGTRRRGRSCRSIPATCRSGVSRARI